MPEGELMTYYNSFFNVSDNFDTIYLSYLGAPSGGTSGHSVDAWGGNDLVYGSSYNDTIHGNGGDDTIYGYAGNDLIFGDDGFDTLSGGNGDDILVGSAGVDQLDGGLGNDFLGGGADSDFYIHQLNSGVDTINDSYEYYTTGITGRGSDFIKFIITNPSDPNQQLWLGRYGNDLLISTVGDVSDGIMNDGLIVKDEFLHDDHTYIEHLQIITTTGVLLAQYELVV